jgi:hypothetical protein
MQVYRAIHWINLVLYTKKYRDKDNLYAYKCIINKQKKSRTFEIKSGMLTVFFILE